LLLKLKDKIVLITGATSGIGKVAAVALAKEGATLVLTSRDRAKGDSVKKEIIKLSGNKKIDVMPCDLSSFKSVSNFCIKYKSKYDRLDVLINNAGIFEPKRVLSKDGVELTFATNHLGPFLLTNLLLELVKQSTPSRIINTSSGLHKRETLPFNDLEGKQNYNGMRAYGRSKLANVMFTTYLADHLKGTGVSVNSFSPGLTYTGLFRKSGAFTKGLMRLIAKNPEKGAQTLIYLASSDDVTAISGKLFSKNNVVSMSKEASNLEIAKKLWQVSQKYVEKYI
jgi:NAD(P)-dependent dehydrogenase (short-subunit alcohol dehydrogenase family)